MTLMEQMRQLGQSTLSALQKRDVQKLLEKSCSGDLVDRYFAKKTLARKYPNFFNSLVWNDSEEEEEVPTAQTQVIVNNPSVVKETKETIIREIEITYCRYCGQKNLTRDRLCSRCEATL